jgi:hypothetical protein
MSKLSSHDSMIKFATCMPVPTRVLRLEVHIKKEPKVGGNVGDH